MKYSIRKIIKIVFLLFSSCILFISCFNNNITQINQDELFKEVRTDINSARKKYKNKIIIISGIINDIDYPIDIQNECAVLLGEMNYDYAKLTGDCICCYVNERLNNEIKNEQVFIKCKFKDAIKTSDGYYLIMCRNGEIVKN